MAWQIGENKYPQQCVVWEKEDHNTYAVVKLGTSHKDKKSGDYLNSNWSFVRFVGKAYDGIMDVPDKTRIVIKSGWITQEPYMKDGIKTWPKSPQITVFAWATLDGAEQPSKEDEPPVVEESEFPF